MLPRIPEPIPNHGAGVTAASPIARHGSSASLASRLRSTQSRRAGAGRHQLGLQGPTVWAPEAKPHLARPLMTLSSIPQA